MNRKIEIEKEVTEKEIDNDFNSFFRYWHKCQHCSRRHSTNVIK